MALLDAELKKLLEWFVFFSETRKQWSEKRKKATEENHKWIHPSVIENMSDQELESKFLEYYNSNTGYKQNLNKLNRDRIIRDKDKFRKTINFLLNENIDIVERINKILEGEYKINGFGKGILTGFLMDFNPEKYFVWNRKTEDFLKLLDFKLRERGDSPGITYLRVVNELQRIRELRSDLNLDSDDIDLFLHTISAENEGIEKVKLITKDELSIEFVKMFMDLQKRIKEWSDAFLTGNSVALDVSSKTAHWYYSPIYDTFGPSKFIGYENISLDEYIPSELDGRDTEQAIKKLKEYEMLEGGHPDFENYQRKLDQFLSQKNKQQKANAQIHISEKLEIRRLMFQLHLAREVFSYKYVMLAALLQNAEDRSKSTHEYFWEFYHDRKNNNLSPDKDASAISSVNLNVFQRGQISSILDAPFEAINNCAPDQPIIIQVNSEYQFNQNVASELKDHKQELIEFTKHKLDQYFNNLDSTQINIWWVNPGKAYKPQREGGFIWAPLLNSQGRPLQHWESMSQVQPGDIVINYSKTKIVAMSVARCKAYAFENELSEELWNKAGRKIDLDYYDLTQPIRLEGLQPLIPSINATIKSNKPFTKVNDVNLGYLFNFNLESLKQIVGKFRDRIPSEILELVGEEVKNYWIFQGNPEIYDINRVMTLGITTSWLVTRYKNDIKEGDQGYLWKSGDNAGVVASFEIVKAPTEEIDETDQGGWITEDKKGGMVRCLIKITSIYPDPPVTRSELLNTDFGRNISIIKNATGTNFKISKEEYDKIMQLIEGAVPMDFNAFLIQKGYYFSPNQIKRFILSLKAKPFVILTGNSGTGKTKIAQLFSEYLEPSKKITKAIVPDNDESGTYFKVGKATLKYGLTLPVDSLDYFNIPKIGEPTEILIKFDGESEKEYFATFGYPDNKEKFANSTIRFRKKLKHYVNQNFSIGDYFRLAKLKDGEFKLEKVNLETEISSDKLTNYVLVPVGANWTDKRHVIGFYNVIVQHYQSTPCLDLILEASKKENKQYPFFLILDEMNLSHVERYFSDFLSAMESDDSIHLHDRQNIEDEDEIPQDLFLPSNLYVIGTVNVDETTYMSSPKVLDRANVIEFPTVPALKYLSGDLQTSAGSKEPSFPGNFSTREMTPAEIFKEMEGVTIEDIRTPLFRSKISHEIETFQNALKNIGFDFGFRVINEVMKYLYLAWEADGKPKKWNGWSEAFDVQILQKMIPKIHGSAKEIQDILKCLYCYCFSGKSDSQLAKLGRGEVVLELYNKDAKEARYKMAARKLQIMQKNLETQRYVSFT